VLHLSEAQVAELLTPAAALTAVEASFHRLARGAIDNPPRVRAEVPGGDFAVMPCVDRELGYAGLKSYAWLANGTPFVIVLFSIEHARLEAVIEAEHLGRLRTAAASAVAAKHLARRDAATLGVVGTGRQAAAHVVALRAVMPTLKRVIVSGRSGVDAFCAAHDCEQGDASSCDVVVTATTSATPVVDAVRPGATVIAVGANHIDQRELGDDVLRDAAFICTDAIDQARVESGDVAHVEPLHELQDVVAGSICGRRSDADIVVFKSNGLAAWDIAVAAALVATASSSSA
jgi:alanine dehydrogenase